MKTIYCTLLFLLSFVPFTPAQNYSLSFDGNSYVTVPNSDTLNLSNHLTIECWFTVQGPSINDWIGMICKVDASAVNYSGYFFGLGESAALPNQLWFLIYPSGNNLNYSFSPTLNQWYNLAVTYNGSVMKMFLDGSLIQQTSANSSIAGNTYPLTIGGQNGNFWNRNLNGKIDEVRISSIARYDTNFIPVTHFDNDPYTIALYHFNEGSGDIVYDSSGNNNSGTIYGAVWSSDVPTNFPLTVDVSNGWNMVSVPGINSNGQGVNNWWVNHVGNVYKFVPGSGYSPVVTATPGEGYWMKNNGAQTYNTGDEWPAGGIQLAVHNPISAVTGWNLFGGYEDVVDPNALTTTPPGQIIYPIYKFVSGTGYQPATQLLPGYSYWVKVTSACQINMPDIPFSK